MKKALSILLSLVVILAALPLTAMNAFAGTYANYEYDLVGGRIIISRYTGSGVSINVPSSILDDGHFYRVDTIGPSAFSSCSSLNTVAIPSSIIYIGTCAFSGCSLLASISIGENVTIIERNAFAGCGSLTSITLPAGLTKICVETFRNCYKLTNVTMGDAVTQIEDRAFYGCSSLASVTIPDHLTSIGNGAFSQCGQLTKVTIPDGVVSIGDSAFAGCSSLTDVLIPASVTTVGDAAFSGCPSLSHYYCYKGSAADTYAANNYLSVVEHYFGDVNGDTDLTVLDFSAAVNASLDETNLTDEVARTVADLNFDGVIDALDCRLVKLLSQGKNLPA